MRSLDRSAERVYRNPMTSRLRITVLALQILFILGTGLQSASATSMWLDMTFGEDMGPGDCEACGIDGHGGSDAGCDTLCTGTFAADQAAIAELIIPAGTQPVHTNPSALFSRTGPPEPFPPRSPF